jgi:hypothetical protein
VIADCTECLVVTELGRMVVLFQSSLPGPLSPRNIFKGHIYSQQSLVVLDVFLNLVDLRPNTGPERLKDHAQS